MKVLLIDCDDSYTLNIYDYLCQVGLDVVLINYKEVRVGDIEDSDYSGIVFSPGPNKPSDIPILLEVIDRFQSNIPILGICLGHQAIGLYYGMKTIESIEPVHGWAVDIYETFKHSIFNDMPNPFKAMRYNSLTSDYHQHDQLKVLCIDDNKEIMGFYHTDFPLLSFQFHPESIATENGLQLFKNWKKIIADFYL